MSLLKRIIPFLPYNQILELRTCSRALNDFIVSKMIGIPRNKKELYFMICNFNFVKYDITKIHSLIDDDLFFLSFCKLVKLNSSERITTVGMSHLLNCQRVVFNGRLLNRQIQCHYYSHKYREVELKDSFVCNQYIDLINATSVTIKNCVLINVELVNTSLYSLRLFDSCVESDFVKKIFYVDFYSLRSTFN